MGTVKLKHFAVFFLASSDPVLSGFMLLCLYSWHCGRTLTAFGIAIGVVPDTDRSTHRAQTGHRLLSSLPSVSDIGKVKYALDHRKRYPSTQQWIELLPWR